MASIPFHLTGEALWRRMDRAVERIQERLEKTARTLEQAGVPLCHHWWQRRAGLGRAGG